MREPVKSTNHSTSCNVLEHAQWEEELEVWLEVKEDRQEKSSQFHSQLVSANRLNTYEHNIMNLCWNNVFVLAFCIFGMTCNVHSDYDHVSTL